MFWLPWQRVTLSQGFGFLADYDDLGGLDLSSLDLEDIELNLRSEPTPVVDGLRFVAFAAITAVIIWFPQSSVYQQLGDIGFFLLSITAVIVGVSFGRWLFRAAERSAERFAQRVQKSEVRVKRPPSALQRWSMLVLAVGGACYVLFSSPSTSYYTGQAGSQNSWFLSALVAIAAGTFFARFLYLQAHRPINPKHKVETIVLPPWFKWITLAVLVVGAITAMILGATQSNGTNDTSTFGLGGVGLFLGIGVSIWLAKRFDEEEKRLRDKTLRERRPQRQQKTNDIY